MADERPHPDDPTPEELAALERLQEQLEAGVDPQQLVDPTGVLPPGMGALLGQMRELYSPPQDSPLADFAEKCRIGKYQIESVQGLGGYALVYRGQDAVLKRKVAIKIPLPGVSLTKKAREKFIVEAQLVAKLDHQHIVKVLEADTADTVPYIVYDYCSGPNLAVHISKNGWLMPAIAAQLTAHLCDAIQHSHDHGVLHRDIKADNVLLFPRQGTPFDSIPFLPRLTDFGLARLIEMAADESGYHLPGGNPAYLPPETNDTTAQDLPSAAILMDVFGLGGILYECLTGRRPFHGETLPEIYQARKRRFIMPVREINPNVPQRLASICEKALAMRPEHRYQTAGDMKRDLERFLDGKAVSARSTWASVAVPFTSVARRHATWLTAATMVLHGAALAWFCMWPACLLSSGAQGCTSRALVHAGGLVLAHSTGMGCAYLLRRGQSYAGTWHAAIYSGLSFSGGASVLSGGMFPDGTLYAFPAWRFAFDGLAAMVYLALAGMLLAMGHASSATSKNEQDAAASRRTL